MGSRGGLARRSADRLVRGLLGRLYGCLARPRYPDLEVCAADDGDGGSEVAVVVGSAYCLVVVAMVGSAHWVPTPAPRPIQCQLCGVMEGNKTIVSRSIFNVTKE